MSRIGFVVLIVLLLGACGGRQAGSPPGAFAAQQSSTATELFFSEYVEGSGNNKALEIYNGTLDEVDLSGYAVHMYFNGNTGPGTIVGLEGTLAPGAVHVVATSLAAPRILEEADQVSNASWYNGDDAVLLVRGGTVVDTIGRVGQDPGSEWGGGSVGTAGNTLRRETAVCTGDTLADDEFDPTVQWQGLAEDTFDGLGAHSSTCAAGEHAGVPEAPETDPELVTPIWEIQGSGDASPVAGSVVTIRGVVVGDFQAGGEIGGFFVQDLEPDRNPATSDGIFVFNRNVAVKPGDEVEVTGEVVEFYGLTELTDVSSVSVVGERTVPEPATIFLPLPDGAEWEHYEGMLVTVANPAGPLVATEVYHLGRGGLVMLADERLVQFTQLEEPSVAGFAAHVESLGRRSLLLDDGSTRPNPDPIPYASSGSELTAQDTLRVGDTTESVTGVLTYGFSGWRGTDAYRLHPTAPVRFDSSNPRPQGVPDVGGRLQVASFNVLNFFNGDGSGGGFPTARGAESRAELERQRAKLVGAIASLDAEVLGFIEIENDGGPNSALAELVAALNAEVGEGTYSYVETGPIGTDEIRVAIAYRPSAVRPVGPYRVLNSLREDEHYDADPRFDDSRNRPALAQTFVDVAGGGRFTVVVNHLKSKGSACPGDRDEAPDGQGNCSEVRTEAALALADWSRELARTSGDPDVLIIGDLNAYAAEDPIRVLLDAGFVNVLGEDASTYVFAGESGTLDYGLASAELAGQVTGAEPWAINAYEPSVLDYNTNFKSARQVELLYSSGPFRSSDHDPVLIGLDPVPGRSGAR